MCYLVFCFFLFFAESSKELEELRAAFSRSLDYMKHDVEERKQTAPTSIFAVFLSWFSFHIIHLPLSLQGLVKVAILLVSSCRSGHG